MCFPVSCLDWSSYVDVENCVETAFQNNRWADLIDLEALTTNERKMLLMEKLSFYYDGTIHTSLELSNRKVSGKLGGLCGMSAVYQAAVDTMFTVFQVKNMTFDELKAELHELMELDPIEEKISSDIDLLKRYHQCRYFR